MLFMRAYAKARAVVQYLRAEVGDADDIAPSLYAGRAKRRKVGAEAPERSPVSSEPGNDPCGISPLSERSNDDAVPAAERPAAAEAADRGIGASPTARDNTPARVAQLFGLLLSGRGPPPGRA